MVQIPERFPTRSADRILAGMLGPVTGIIQLEMRFDYLLAEKRLERAVALLTRRIPMLGCRFVPKKLRPYFQRLDTERLRLFHLTTDKAGFNAFKNQRMDFFTGPQIETCLYRSGSGDRFLIKVSHLVCDAAGVKQIAEELSTIYNRLKDTPGLSPQPILMGNRGFRRISRRIPWYAVPLIVYNYLVEIYQAKVPAKSHVVPVQKGSDSRIQLQTTHVGKKKFTALATHAKKAGATINDLLTTAIIRALSKTGDFSPDTALRLGMAVDLRRYMAGGPTGSIANFSSLERFNYGSFMEPEFEATLARVTETTRRRKSSWLGLSTFTSTYPLLWGLPFFILRIAGHKGWETWRNSPNTFDWLTNMGEIQKQTVDFDGQPSAAWLLVPGCTLPMLFFGCSSYDGTLTLSWSTSADETNQEVAQAFFGLVMSELESVAGINAPL